MSNYANFQRRNKSFFTRLGEKKPMLYFLLLDLYFGALAWVVCSLIVPDVFGRFDVTSLFAWLWGGAIFAFIFYVNLKKEGSDLKRLGEGKSMSFFLLVGLCVGALIWVVGSLLFSTTFGRFTLSSLSSWLGVGAICAFLFYVDFKKAGSEA